MTTVTSTSANESPLPAPAHSCRAVESRVDVDRLCRYRLDRA